VLNFVVWNKKIVAVVCVAVVLLLGTSYYFYSQYQKSQERLHNPAEVSKKETTDLIAKVGTLIELPIGEEPTVATVSDPARLVGQAFFINAKVGDKVLIYTLAKKAILYRPSINKIIEVAPVNLAQAPTVATPSATISNASPAAQVVTKKINVAVYNGTNTSGLATKTADSLSGKFPDVVIVSKNNAKGNYTKTLVVDLTGNLKSKVAELATFLGGEARSLPDGETKPSADILVIAGE